VGGQAPPNKWFFLPLQVHIERRFIRFSRLCETCGCDIRTDRQTDHRDQATLSIAVGRIYTIIIIIIIIIKRINIAQVRKGHKCAMSAEMAVWLRNCLCLYSYLHN